MFTRWIAFLLLAVFSLQWLPALSAASKDGCAWLAEDSSEDMGEETGEDPVLPFKTGTHPAYQPCVGWARNVRGDAQQKAPYRLTDTALRLPRVERDVHVPPPDATV